LIISHEYKFIFIKTGKTAGTSIEVFLSQFCENDDVVTPIYPRVESHVARNFKGLWNPFPELIENRDHGVGAVIDLLSCNRYFNHMSARIIKNRISAEIWDSYFKFCVERNPWDKTLSHYHMINDRSGGSMTFENYLNRGKFCMNYPKYTDSNGNLLVDEVIKYELLMDELARIFGELGIPFAGSLGVRAKSEHRKNSRPYQEVYSREQMDVIARAFATEIQMHGYLF